MNQAGLTQDQSKSGKATSYSYGDAYQRQMLVYYRQLKTASENSTVVETYRLVRELIDRAHSMQGRRKQDTIVVDVGCSVGTFAIECSKMGFRSFGVDFDKNAIDL